LENVFLAELRAHLEKRLGKPVESAMEPKLRWPNNQPPVAIDTSGRYVVVSAGK
jgi:hypothetical protein